MSGTLSFKILFNAEVGTVGYVDLHTELDRSTALSAASTATHQSVGT
jgi:hypothetical protein